MFIPTHTRKYENLQFFLKIYSLHVFFSCRRFKLISDENQHAFKNPLHIPLGPITRARSKKIKEALNGLIQEIWADSNVRHSKFGPKEDEGVII